MLENPSSYVAFRDSTMAEWEFLSLLKEEGRRSADEFLRVNGANLGVRSTDDLDVLLAES